MARQAHNENKINQKWVTTINGNVHGSQRFTMSENIVLTLKVKFFCPEDCQILGSQDWR